MADRRDSCKLTMPGNEHQACSPEQVKRLAGSEASCGIRDHCGAISALHGSRHKVKHRVEASWESTGCQGRIPGRTRCSVAVAWLAAGMSDPQEQRRPLPQPAELA